MKNLKKYHVATGSYVIGGRQSLALEAFLGTCVGVAIFDSKAQVGGLMHILLPEPVSSVPPESPKKYAASGMPLFISELAAAGAATQNMRAWIAGGALMAPLTQQDMALDIGGRTVEIVRRLLEAAGIAVEHEETGGFFTCSIELDMTDWRCRIRPAGEENGFSQAEFLPPEAREIEDTMAQVQPIPQVALKILRVVNEDRYDFRQIAEEVRKDQVISAKTLQLCNSAFFAGRRKIDSLDDALIILGQEMLVKSILMAAVNKFFHQDRQGYALCKGGLYHHALSAAMIAEKLAQKTGRALPTVAYTAALLHDIGMIVLDQYVARSYPFFYRGMQNEKKNILEIERKVLGIDHPQAGKRLAEKWSFPENLTDAVAFHHEPEKAQTAPELVHIVYLAEFLTSRFLTRLELERTNTDRFEQRIQRIGLKTSDFNDIVDLIPIGAFGDLFDKDVMSTE